MPSSKRKFALTRPASALTLELCPAFLGSTNALNYTPAGSVQVRTYLEGDHVCLGVEDTGMGIDPEDLPHLFERFYRGKGVSQGGIRGTGLGLSIVKEIVDLHKGSIEIDSQPGKGTTFTVRLPLEE